MKKSWKKVVVSVVALFSSAAAHAEIEADDVLKYSTLGVWVGSPLGVSARVGLAVPLSKDTAITFGNEFGANGSKQFVSYRAAYVGHGVGWGGVDLARWKTRSHPWLADEHTEYYGLEAQVLFFRAGLLIPKGGSDHHPKVSLGAGLSF